MPSTLAQLAEDGDLTIDMLGQYAYCPRRFHLMYVQGRWDDNALIVQGRQVHSRLKTSWSRTPCLNIVVRGGVWSDSRPVS